MTDQTGAALPGVTVVATETRTNVSHDTVTNETGNFTFPNIADGIYNVKAELAGFKATVREGMRLAVNTSIRVDLSLSVGAIAETVTVTGETPLLQTDRTDTGRTLESIQVASMPLAFNRNFQGMMATVPGASPAPPRALRVLQLAGQPGDGSERPVAHGATTCRSKASTTTSGPACSPC